MVGEACLPSNAYYPRTPDYTLYSGVHVCWSEHSDSSFVYGFMSLDYGLGTMTTTTYLSANKHLYVLSLLCHYYMFCLSANKRLYVLSSLCHYCMFCLSANIRIYVLS